jgi:beta-xylosidase
MRRRATSLVLLAVAALVLTSCGPELGRITKLASIPAPVLPETSDPSVVRVGREYFLYGSNNHLRAPITRLPRMDQRLTLNQKNARTIEGMPAKPAWTANGLQLWAPTVGKFGNRWVMFFSADRKSPPQPHNPQCVGRAFATSPLGPFVPEAKAWHCGRNGTGGALDPELFTDRQGRRWLHVAMGDTESPIHAIRLDGNANQVGSSAAILSRVHPWEYHFIEQPAMVYDASRGNYLLAYSAGRWWESRYSTGIARCSSPSGPCTSDPSGPWIRSSAGRTGPGGLSWFTDTSGKPHAIFSTFAQGGETRVGGRSATVMKLNTQPTVHLQRATR